jgi:hypothetical protein
MIFRLTWTAMYKNIIMIFRRIRNGNAGINGMGHHLSTSKRDSIQARTDEDPVCVRFISLGSKVLHWLRN